MTAEEKLKRIAEIYGIGPDLGLGRWPGQSHHARDNLDGALMDIERQWKDPDPVCLRTLRRVKHQLFEIEQILKG